MYKSEKIWLSDPLTGELTGRTYLDGHMENMVAGKRAQMEAITRYLATMQEHGMGAGNAQYDEAMAKHKSMYASLLMWETQLCLINEDGKGEYTRNYHAKEVSGIEYDAETGNIVYTLHQINQEDRDINGNSINYIESAVSRERRRELEERLLNLSGKYLGDVVTSVGLSALMVVAPELAIFTTAALSMMSGTSNIKTGLGAAVDSKAGGLTAGAVEKVINATLNSYAERNKLIAALKNENEKDMLAWFGALGEVKIGDQTYLLGGGLYDPDKYRVLSMYQNGRVIGDDKNAVKGMAALAGWNTDTVKEMKKAIDGANPNNLNDAQKQVARQIIDGSFDITDVTTYDKFVETLDKMKNLVGSENDNLKSIGKATEYFE